MPAPTLHNEPDLLQKVANGDESAFSELFYRYHQTVGVIVYRIILSRPLTEEIVQDIFLKIWKNRVTLTSIDNFGSWLQTVARNQSLNCLRKLVTERQQRDKWQSLAGRAFTGSSLEGEIVGNDAFNEDQFELIDEAISALPAQQKKVFILSRYRRLKYEEIAAELNLSRETVKSYIKLATTSISRFVTSRLSSFILVILSFLAR